MGLFTKSSGKSLPPPTPFTSRKTQATGSREPNVLHNPSAYLAYGGDGIDRGAMMAQQAATRTHQQAMNAHFQRARNDDRLPPPREHHPVFSQMKKEFVSKLTEVEKNFLENFSLGALQKVTTLYLSQTTGPEWGSAFKRFGFNEVLMSAVKLQWDSALKGQKELLIKAYKKEGNIPDSEWLLARDSAARATGRFVTRSCLYNGVTVSVQGRFNNDTREPYFDFTVPISKEEFISWRKALMDQYNSKRTSRGFEPIELDGSHAFAGPLPVEVSVLGLP